MASYNIRKEMKKEFAKDDSKTPVRYHEFLHGSKGDIELAKVRADNYNKTHNLPLQYSGE